MNTVSLLIDEAADKVEKGPSRAGIYASLVEQIRALIIEGDLGEGARISERALCERFGVSRTPLREALKVLAAEGVVDLLPNRGARVAAVPMAEIVELLTVMGALESLAARLACERITDDQIAEVTALHYQMVAHFLRRDLPAYFRLNQAIDQAIVKAAGNAVLASLNRQLSTRLRRARYAANLNAARWNDAVAEHEEILAALTARDGARLGALLQEHFLHKVAELAHHPIHPAAHDTNAAG